MFYDQSDAVTEALRVLVTVRLIMKEQTTKCVYRSVCGLKETLYDTFNFTLVQNDALFATCVQSVITRKLCCVFKWTLPVCDEENKTLIQK